MSWNDGRRVKAFKFKLNVRTTGSGKPNLWVHHRRTVEMTSQEADILRSTDVDVYAILPVRFILSPLTVVVTHLAWSRYPLL
jgi:hypothetical protein